MAVRQILQKMRLVSHENVHAQCIADACVHELFEIQVDRTPDACAIIFKDQSITYRELNRRANHVAGTWLTMASVQMIWEHE